MNTVMEGDLFSQSTIEHDRERRVQNEYLRVKFTICGAVSPMPVIATCLFPCVPQNDISGQSGG